MPNINLIDNQAICTEVTSVNNVALANIAQIDNITKDCAHCDTIQLSKSDLSCGRACVSECETLYTDKDITISPLGMGDHIYLTSDCICENEGYLWYADVCGARGGDCYTIDEATCEIINITEC